MIPPIDYEWACDQCPEVRAAHDKANRQAEYGVNWYEFINITQGLDAMLERWWRSLDTNRKHEMLDKSIADCESKLEQLREARKS